MKGSFSIKLKNVLYLNVLLRAYQKWHCTLFSQALHIREVCNCPPLSGPDPRLLFKLSMKNFRQELEKEDRNTIVKKQKMDPLSTQTQEQIPLTYMVEKQTGS